MTDLPDELESQRGMVPDLAKKLLYFLNDYDAIQIAHMFLHHPVAKYGLQERTVKGWFKTNDPVTLRKKSRDSIVLLLKHHKVQFAYRWFSMSFDRMVEEKTSQAALVGMPEVGTGEAENFDRLDAIAGLYQVIRPFVGVKKSFVLEVMEFKPKRAVKNLLMFTHNLADPAYLYLGDLRVSNRFGFGVIQRRHDKFEDAVAMRCLVTNVSLTSRQGRYMPRHALSGMILRGVTGHDTAPLPAAVPFVAFRPKTTDIALEQARFRKLEGELKTIDGHYLIGVVDKESPAPLREFCMNLFASLRKNIVEDMVLRAVSPDQIDKQTGRGRSEPDAMFEKWKKATAKIFG